MLIARLRPLSAGEREAELERACAVDPTLEARRAEIRAELDPGATPDAFPSESSGRIALRTAMHALESALDLSAPETSGAVIGPYKLLQKIGEGGFGTVWMAEQLEPIRRRVALKIVKIGMDTDEVIARFEVERQALALMDHPNIARVFDAGATASGRPYFVMELVRGVAITRYCDDNRLTAEARLRLFIAVCQAVQHAHQKGVIHRDLKPSNILVTLADAVPIPKVIDFGIAKATEKRLTEKTLITQFHAFVGTPAYTSPEQMEMSALDVDTRADIYSLGVLLYELLAGRPPFDPEALMKSGLDAMRRMIREVDPPRPSSRLSTLSEAERTSVAHARGTDAAKLSVALRGDLDWIVMRCLEKDRTRRYETANGLAHDVQRFLADEPVAARPPSTLYRLSKIARRHRLAFIASTAVALSIVAAFVVSSFLFWRERAAHARAETAEKSEGALRRKAEIAKTEETTRAARTALELANRELDEGRVADGLAWLVYAAAKDPLSPVIAPRIASALAAHSFLLPEGAPFECGSWVVATRFARDGRTFFVGTVDGTMRVFDSESGRIIRQFALGRPVKLFGGFAFARDNDAVFAARFHDDTPTNDNIFAVFDLATGERITAPIATTRIGSPNDPDLNPAVGLSPNGRWAYAIHWDGFDIWELATAQRRSALKWKEVGPFSDFDFSADGRHVLVLVGSAVHVLPLADGKPFEKRIVLPSQGRSLARFTPDGERIAVFERSVGIRLFALDGTKLGEAVPCTEPVQRNAWDFMPDGRLLLVSRDSAQMLDLKTQRATPLPFGWSGHFWARDFSPDGTRLLTLDAGGAARLWDTTTGTLAAEPVLQQSSHARIALSPDGTHIVIGTALGGVRRLRVTRDPARGLALPHVAPAIAAMFFPDKPGRLLVIEPDRARSIDVASAREMPDGFSFPHPVAATVDRVAFPPLRSDRAFLVSRDPSAGWESWDLGADRVRKIVALREAPQENARVLFSQVRDRVLLTTSNGLRVWDLRTGEPVGPPIANRPNSPGGLPVVQFSPEGERLVMTGAGVANVLEISSGRELVRFEPLPRMMIHYGVFSPDGTRVVTALRAGEARLWDAATGAPLSPVRHHPDIARDPFFSHNGSFFATSTETEMRFWDARTAELLGGPLDVKDNRTAVLSSDDERVLVVSNSGVPRVWHVRTGQPLTEPMLHPKRIAARARFSPDGRFALTHSSPIHVWPVPPSQPAGGSVPDWLLQLATAHAGKYVDENGKFRQASDVTSLLEAARRTLRTLPGDAPLAEWGRWILDDRADRPIAPGFTVTETEAKKLFTERAPERARP